MKRDGDEQLEELLERTLLELRRLRSGQLIARLSEAEIDAIALRCADRLEERLLPRIRQEPTDPVPRRTKSAARRKLNF